MESKLTDRLEKAWLKPKSIPIAFALIVIAYFALVSILSALDGVTLTDEHYRNSAIIAFFVWCLYIGICLYKYRLPRAKKNCVAVLFCIDAESEKLFATAKSKLVSNFQSSLEHNAKIQFKALCIPKQRVSKYDLKRDQDCLKLLCKTHSVLLVQVQYTADDVDDSENFKLAVCYGVRHPEIDGDVEKALSYDMARLGAPIRRQRFEKKNAIDVFDFTTQALVFACQYIMGFAVLLAGDGTNAVTLLLQARKLVEINEGGYFDVDNLLRLVDDRLFSAYNLCAARHLGKFQNDYSIKHLEKMDENLESANCIHPDTYAYNLGKAYVLVGLYKDGSSARQCIEKCKKLDENNDWLYSEAFLCAYMGRDAGIVISKYARAFRTPYENLVELAGYIEFVLEQEPEKMTLHLAAGLIYSKIGDSILTKQHIAIYLANVPQTDRRALEKIDKLMQSTTCDVKCGQNCVNCSYREAG